MIHRGKSRFGDQKSIIEIGALSAFMGAIDIEVCAGTREINLL